MPQHLTKRFKLRLVLVKLFDLVCRMPKWRTLHKVLKRAGESSEDFFFVQIGANDGVIYDPIFPYVTRFKWSGILIEPVPCYFDKLKHNYRGNKRLIFDNVAISDKDEMRDFFRIREDLDFLPEWCNGLGTFDLNILLTHKWAIPNLEDYVVKEKVACTSYESLLNRHGIKKIDLLLIDTEGYDYQILKQVNLDVTKPAILLYEHQYIDQKERSGYENRLESFGYTVSRHFGNTLAYCLD